MASIKRTLSSRIDSTGKSEILLRIIIDGKHKQRIKSGIFVTAARFQDGKIVKPRIDRKEAEELSRIEDELISLERFLISLCNANEPGTLTKEFILAAVDKFLHPENKDKARGFFDIFKEFIENLTLQSRRIDHYKVLYRELWRFQGLKRGKYKRYDLTFDSLTEETLNEFVKFLKTEPQVYHQHPELYKENISISGEKGIQKIPKAKGKNTISSKLKLFRSFVNWAVRKGYAQSSPSWKYFIRGESYGRPFFLTIEERNKLSDFDFSEFPDIEAQRDIFIFQCLIGCRISDLYSLTSGSVIDGAVEYVPAKTKGQRAEVVRVPLNQQARKIYEKYKGRKGDKLFPFIRQQDYNYKIRQILRKAGIDRMVTVINPTTLEDEKRPIYEVAGSQLARRTFIGNLYKKVKDPNLIGSLSGHKEGSKAFARYRDIDEELKKELVSLL